MTMKNYANGLLLNRLFGISISNSNGIIMSKINSPASIIRKP